MTDIAEQLRRMSRMLTYSPEEAAETPEAKAADEIERLRADVAMLRGEITCYEDEASDAEDGFEHDLRQERAENDTLRREIARLQQVLETVAQHGRVDDSESRMNDVGAAIVRCRKITVTDLT